MWPGDPGSVSGTAAAHDQQVFEDRARRARAHREALGRLIEPFAQIDPAVRSERPNRSTRLAVERPEIAAIRDEHPIPVDRDAAVAEPAAGPGAAARIELPDLASGGRVERDHLQRRRRGVQHAVDDDRVALHLRSFERVARIVGPGHAQRRHVVAMDLRERRVADVVGAAVHRPTRVGGGDARLKASRCGNEKKAEGDDVQREGSSRSESGHAFAHRDARRLYLRKISRSRSCGIASAR